MTEPDTVAIALRKDKYGRWTVERLYLVQDTVVDAIRLTEDRGPGTAFRVAREAMDDLQTEITRGKLDLPASESRKPYEDV